MKGKQGFVPTRSLTAGNEVRKEEICSFVRWLQIVEFKSLMHLTITFSD
jgi:hypothetical protein